jgi:hypothetical protein
MLCLCEPHLAQLRRVLPRGGVWVIEQLAGGAPGPSAPPSSWSPRAPTPAGCAATPPWPPCSAPAPSRHPPATTRHRLNRGGDRAASNALWTIAHIRMISDPRTRAYVAKRTATGNSRKEIMRILQRYIARELYPLIIDAFVLVPVTVEVST